MPNLDLDKIDWSSLTTDQRTQLDKALADGHVGDALTRYTAWKTSQEQPAPDMRLEGADMKLISPQDDPKTGLRFDVRYGDEDFDPETGLSFSTKYEPQNPDIDPKTGLSFSKTYPDAQGAMPPPQTDEQGLAQSQLAFFKRLANLSF